MPMIIDPTKSAGWEPGTPVTDTLLRRFLENWIGSLESEVLPAGGAALRRDDFAAVDLGHPGGLSNVVTLASPVLESGIESVMSAIDDFFKFDDEKKSGSVFLFCPWPTPDLTPFGWKLIDYLPLMYRPACGEFPPIPPGLTITKVVDEAGLLAFEHVIVRGFPFDSPEAQIPGAVFVPAMLQDERNQFWVGWDGDRPVSAAAAFVAEGLNDVTLVATLPEARRRGFGAAVTWRATLADPSLPAMLMASDEGRPVYESMGYLSLFKIGLWIRERIGRQEAEST